MGPQRRWRHEQISSRLGEIERAREFDVLAQICGVHGQLLPHPRIAERNLQPVYPISSSQQVSSRWGQTQPMLRKYGFSATALSGFQGSSTLNSLRLATSFSPKLLSCAL